MNPTIRSDRRPCTGGDDNAAGTSGRSESYVIEAAADYLDAMIQTHAEAASRIGDTDYARTLAELNRARILGEAALSALAMANADASSMLDLLL